MNSSTNLIRKKFLKRLEILNMLNFLKDQYVNWERGPLAIRGLRDARDIDLVVSKALWMDLRQKHALEVPKKDKIHIDEIIADGDVLEGFPSMKLSWRM
jgi:hypothetical protein